MPSRTRPAAQCPTTPAVSAPGRRRGRPDVVRESGREIRHVVALVAVLRDGLAAMQGGDGRAEDADLAARVVEVVLARHPLAAGLQDAAQQVADERPPGVADVQRPGRIGRDELDVDDPRIGRGHAPAPAARVRQHATDDRLERPIGEPQIDEARRRDRRLRRRRRRRAVGGLPVQLRRERVRDDQRRHPQGPRELHRQVRRQVAVDGVSRSIHLHGRGDPVLGCRGQRAVRRPPGPRRARWRFVSGHGWRHRSSWDAHRSRGRASGERLVRWRQRRQPRTCRDHGHRTRSARSLSGVNEFGDARGLQSGLVWSYGTERTGRS